MPPDTPSPEHQSVTDLVRGDRESRSIQNTVDARLARDRVDEVAQNIRSFAGPRPGEDSEAHQARQKALMAAIETIAAREGVSADGIIGLIWPIGDGAEWFRANLRERDPQMVEQTHRDLTDIETAWNGLQSLPPSDRQNRPEYKTMGEKIFQMSARLDRCSVSELQELMTTHQFFRRLSSLHRNVYGHAQDIHARELMRSIRTLAVRMPTLSAREAVAHNFIQQNATILQGALGRRTLFFAMARNGPRIGNQTYMNHTSYNSMANDLANGTVRIPEGTNYRRNDPVAGGEELMYLYNGGGFQIAEILSSLVRQNNPQLTEQIRKSQILVRLFELATYPSPYDGHVTLSAQAIILLADIADVNPGLLNDFIDTRDPVLGQTPRQFFAANALDSGPIPFDELTADKRSTTYRYACQKLIGALGIERGAPGYRRAYEQYGTRVRNGTASPEERQILFKTLRGSWAMMNATDASFFRRFLLHHDPHGPEAATDVTSYQSAYEVYGSRVQSGEATPQERQVLFKRLRDDFPRMASGERQFYEKFIADHDR